MDLIEMSKAGKPSAQGSAAHAHGGTERLPDPVIVIFRVLAVVVALVLAGANLFGVGNAATTPSQAAAQDTGAPNTVVEIHNAHEFRPAMVTIPVGGSVTWFNDHSEDHTASGAGGINSGRLHPDQLYTHTFNEPGTYEYVCAYHSDMQGMVMVADASGNVPPPAAPPPPGGANPPPPGTGGKQVPVSIGESAGAKGPNFSPRDLTIPAGSVVTWTNNDASPHTATGDGGIDSGNLNKGKSYSKTFNTPGAFHYVCVYHSDMTGTINVTNASGQVPAPPPGGGGGGGSAPPPGGGGGGGAPAPPGSGGAGGGGGTQAPAKASVSIKDDFFSPKTVTISAGDTVTWTNTGKNPHTVTGDGFDSGTVSPGSSFRQTFKSPGTFGYICVYHSGMSGTVKVAAASGKVPPGSPAPGGGKAPSGGGGKAPSGGGGKASGGGSGGGAPAAGSQTITVTMASDSFSPGSVDARVGDTVVWKNGSTLPHTVSGGPFNSGMVAPGQSYTAVLRSQGTISYKCDYHPGMTGKLKVAAAPAGVKLPPPSADQGVSGGAAVSSSGGATSSSGATGGSSSGPAAPSAKSYTVTMTGNSFDPQVLKARVGDEVTWVNKDPAPHNVTGGPLASDLIMTGGEFSTVLTEAGTIDYQCTLHPGMTGTIEVAAALPGTAIPPPSAITSSGSTDTGDTTGGASSPSAKPSAGAQNHDVQIVDFLYDPDPLEVHVGDTVTFLNKDAAPHTATAEDKSWDSGNLNQGDKWTVELTKTGTIPYICIYHPDMAGTIVVKPKTEELAAAPAGSGSDSSADLSGLSARQIAGFASGWIAVLAGLAWLQLRSRRRQRAAGQPTNLAMRRGILRAIRWLAAAALAVSAYLHFVVAFQTGLEGEPFTMPQLFVIQGVLCILAAVLVLVRDDEVFWLPALAVAVGSMIPLLVSVYFPIPALGPLPPLNEPVWYGEKVLSLAVVALIPLLWVIRRIAPPPEQNL